MARVWGSMPVRVTDDPSHPNTACSTRNRGIMAGAQGSRERGVSLRSPLPEKQE